MKTYVRRNNAISLGLPSAVVARSEGRVVAEALVAVREVVGGVVTGELVVRKSGARARRVSRIVGLVDVVAVVVLDRRVQLRLVHRVQTAVRHLLVVEAPRVQSVR